jgi:hypothetical protein
MEEQMRLEQEEIDSCFEEDFEGEDDSWWSQD